MLTTLPHCAEGLHFRIFIVLNYMLLCTNHAQWVALYKLSSTVSILFSEWFRGKLCNCWSCTGQNYLHVLPHSFPHDVRQEWICRIAVEIVTWLLITTPTDPKASNRCFQQWRGWEACYARTLSRPTKVSAVLPRKDIICIHSEYIDKQAFI